MKNSVIKTAAAVAMAWLAVSPAAANDATAQPAQSTFDVSVQAATCFTCHGTGGTSPGSIPSIAGRPESVLLMQLKGFQADPPPAGTTVMNRLAKGYSAEELAALARYFSQVSR
ncbi:MAG: hypothetical protein M0R28_00400 [Pigmentiphaga sp.]|nr:hypothetical protein [Pigmentiphaga sp.]